MDFTHLVGTLRRRWKTVALLTLVAVIFSLTLSVMAKPSYRSTADVFVTSNTQNLQEAWASSMFVTQRVGSYAAMANHRALMATVVDELDDLDLTVDELAGKVSAEVEPDTQIIKLSVVDDSPEAAQRIAATLSEEFVKFLKKLETPTDTESSQILPSITNPATYNAQPITPRTVLNTIVALMLGLLVGVTTALCRELLDTSIKSAEDVSKTVDTPVMAAIGVDPTMAKNPLPSNVSTFSTRAEAFRLLRTNLQFLDLDQPPRSIVITSSVSGEGKTTTSTNLAVALAQAGRRVLLVDGDLRRPRVAQLMGLESSVGLTTVLVGRSKLEESIQRHKETGVHVLASGPTPPNPSEILQAKATHDLLARLSTAYDLVIIDAPPLLPVADAAILATAADGAIIVTRHGKTTRDQLEAAHHRLESVGARTFGVVLNLVPKRFGQRNYYYYYYYGEDRPKTGGKRSAKA